MNDTQFSAAVAQALCRIGETGIALKAEQVQAAYQGRDVFLWLYWQVHWLRNSFLSLSVALK